MNWLWENDHGRCIASAVFLGSIVAVILSPVYAVAMFLMAFAGQSGVLLAKMLFGG